MKPAVRYFLMGLAAGLPLNFIVSIMRWSQAQFDAATQHAPPIGIFGIFATQLAISLAVGFVGWRWSYLSPVRMALGVMAVLAVPSAIVGGWLSYTHLITELMP